MIYMGKSPDNSSGRVFFALWPNDAERAALSAWQTPLRQLCGGRAMRADTLHATLVFIGDVADARLEALRLAAQQVRAVAFWLPLERASYWGHNHIVYAAPGEMPEPLLQLVRQLEHQLAQHGFHFDHRGYKPHVTLLRNAKWGDIPLPAMPGLSWMARDFALVRSLRDDGGARYEVLARFPLIEAGLP